VRRDRAPDPRRARDGIPFDRIAVLLRAPDAYGPFLAEALRRAGIPRTSRAARGALIRAGARCSRCSRARRRSSRRAASRNISRSARFRCAGGATAAASAGQDRLSGRREMLERAREPAGRGRAQAAAAAGPPRHGSGSLPRRGRRTRRWRGAVIG
jgi:hypothetical protein